MVQSLHIQQVKLEADGEAYHPEERLEGAGDIPTGELAKAKLSEGEIE
jgi:hypothetical protein